MSLLVIAGPGTAARHMENAGVPADGIERIISGAGMQRRKVRRTPWPLPARRQDGKAELS